MSNSNIEHKVATGLVLSYMKSMGYIGWTGFNNTIYYIDENHMKDERLQRHELKHIEQINDLGRVLFTVKYLWYAITVGYDENPFELEARKAEDG